MKWSRLKHGLMHGIVIMNFAGNPYVQLKEEKTKPKLKEKLSLKSDTYIRTNPNDYVILRINDRYQVTVLPDSIFTLDGIRQKEEFTVRSVYIRRGKVHIIEEQDQKEAIIKDLEKKSKSKSKIKVLSQKISAEPSVAQIASQDVTDTKVYEPLKIESDFFSFLTPTEQKLSLFIDINLKEAWLNVCNFGPPFKLGLFDHEEPQILKPNDGVKFQGMLTKSGQLAYDLLLEKRKIPKGKWLAQQACSVNQVKQIQDEVIKFHWQAMHDAEKARLARIAEKKRNDSIYLCHEPYGKLDQCHFILRQNKCIRERCNAEGKWTDQTEIGVIKNLCRPQGEVKGCGY